MTLLAALLLAVQVATPAPSTRPPPAELATLPPLPWRTVPAMTDDLGAFVAEEVRAGRCALGHPLTVEFAVLVGSDGRLRGIVPRAIDCSTVEQYGAGLITRFARNNLRTPAAGWYRAELTIAWSR